jgi:hypothetical protein
MESELRLPADRACHRFESRQALLVCAYEDEEKCRTVMLEGALTMKQFEERLGSLPLDANILFYCA